MKVTEATYFAAELKQPCRIHWLVVVVSYSGLNMSLVERDTAAVRSLGLVWESMNALPVSELEASMKGNRESFKNAAPGQSERK